jgi:hypothetical protein
MKTFKLMEVKVRKHLSPTDRVRMLLVIFMVGLTLSGFSAIPLRREIEILYPFMRSGSWLSEYIPAFSAWIDQIYRGIQNGYGEYPFLAYGTDWLAFGHVAIATAFIGPLRNPVKNIWVLEFGMIVCLLTIPWTLIFGLIREIPLFWQLIDMSFGVFGFIPLWFARRDILKISSEL